MGNNIVSKYDKDSLTFQNPFLTRIIYLSQLFKVKKGSKYLISDYFWAKLFFCINLNYFKILFFYFILLFGYLLLFQGLCFKFEFVLAQNQCFQDFFQALSLCQLIISLSSLVCSLIRIYQGYLEGLYIVFFTAKFNSHYITLFSLS